MKRAAEAAGGAVLGAPVGEHSAGLEGRAARSAGAGGKANVGMSNDNAGEKPAHRKAKGS